LQPLTLVKPGITRRKLTPHLWRVTPGAKLETSKMANFNYFDDDSLIYSAV